MTPVTNSTADVRLTRRRTAILACSIWACFIGWLALFVAFWRFDVAQPHGMWAVASLLTTIGLTIFLVVYFAKCTWRRIVSRSILGWTLIGLFPAPATGLYYLQSQHQFSSRQTVMKEDSLSLVATKFSVSVLDATSWLSHSRSVQGRHVELIDQGQTPQARRLVTEMDAHVREMADQIGQSPPRQRIGWVRGSMFGHDGVAIGRWAICGRDLDAAELTALDRHEVAHAMIFQLCGPDEDAPTLLIEGWAESQSVDRHQLIGNLVNDYRIGDHFTLDELISKEWYLSIQGPVYTHGGPFVVFLIERYSAPKFFELYRSVCRDSFRQDVQRILGTNWSDLEAEFWQWLMDQAEPESTNPIEPYSHVTLDANVDRQDWERFLQRISQESWDRPRETAFEMQLRVENDQTGQVGQQTITAVFAGDDCWMRVTETDERDEFFLVNERECINATRDKAGKLSVSFRRRGYEKFVRRLIANQVRSAIDPNRLLPVDAFAGEDDSSIRYHVNSLKPADSGDPQWVIQFEYWYEANDEIHPKRHANLVRLDDSAKMAVIYRREDLDAAYEVVGGEYMESSEPEIFGGCVYPANLEARLADAQGNVLRQMKRSTRRLSSSETTAFKAAVEDVLSEFYFHSRWSGIRVCQWMFGCVPIVGAVLLFVGRTRREVDA